MFRYFGIKITLLAIVICFILALYSYFIADSVITKITDAQMTKVDGRYMIATEYRPFVNYDAKYRLKFDSELFKTKQLDLRAKK